MALGDRRRWGNTIAVIVILSVIVILLVVVILSAILILSVMAILPVMAILSVIVVLSDSSMITIVSFYRDSAPVLYNWMMR